MAEWLYSIDLAIFRFGNETLTFGAGDWFFPFITNIKNFIPIYAVILLALMIVGKKRGVFAVVLILLAVAIGDQLNSSLIKEWVGRIRPCHVLEHVRLLVDCGSGKSFPSSHAVNNFAAAMVAGWMYPKARPYVFVFAALVAWSRVYVGVHYPSDILAGAVEGLLIGWGLMALFQFGQSKVKWLQTPAKKNEVSA